MKQPYHPLYFLSALGNGGLAVSFFIFNRQGYPYFNRVPGTARR